MDAKKVFKIVILSFFGGIFLIPFAPGIFLFWMTANLLSLCGYTLIREREKSIIAVSMIVGAIVALGVHCYHTTIYNAYFRGIKNISISSQPYTIAIEGYEKRGKQGDQVIGKIISSSGNISLKGVKVLITTDTNIRPEIGKTITTNTKLSIPKNSEDFGYRSYLLSKGIGVTTQIESFVYEDTNIHHLPWWQPNKSLQIREHLYQIMRNIFPTDTSNFLSGMIFGDTSRLSVSIEELARSTGISHLLVVSGSNITLILICLSALFWWFPRYIRIPLVLGGMLLFVWIVGGGIPALRAACMGGIGFLITQLDKKVDIMAIFLTVGALFALWNPLSIYYDMSFFLSFGATGAIILYYHQINIFLSRHITFGIIRESAAVTISATIGVLPIMILSFHEISWVSIPLNTLIGPIIGPTTILGILATSLEIGGLHSFSASIAQLAHWGYMSIVSGAEWFRTYGASNTHITLSIYWELPIMTFIGAIWVYSIAHQIFNDATKKNH